MKRFLCLVPAVAAAALAQTNSPVVREGRYFVQTITGSAPVENTLSVSTVGGVIVRGEPGRSGLAYTLKRRVRANDETEARRMLERLSVKTFNKASATVLEVTVPSRSASADLDLRIPRTLRDVAIATSAGGVQVRGLNGSARVDTAAGAVEADDIAGAVTIRSGGGAVRLGRIGGHVETYSVAGAILAESLGSDAGLNTGGGEIVVREAKGLVRAKSVGGAIRIERALKGVQIAAGAGIIDVQQAGGPVVAETVSGSIRVRSASNVRCESGAGTLQLQAVSGELRATTKAGGIIADLSGAEGLRDSVLTTTTGDITVFIPSNLAVTVEAINTSPGGHRIVSDFPQVRPQLEQGGSVARGALNGGGPVVRLAVSNGMIYLRRQK